MRLVLDTNVLLAAVLAPGLSREMMRTHLLAHDLFCSPGLLQEFADKLRDKLEVDPVELPFFVAYSHRVKLVDPSPFPAPVCRDPDDDLVLATAVAAQAHCILTGDKDLLVLKKFQSVRILTPRQFLELPIA